MPGHRQRSTNPRIRAGEVTVIVLHQPVGEARVPFAIAVAGNDQVIGQGAGQALQMLNQRLAAPLDQALVASAHALPLTPGQKQDGAGRQGVKISHGELGQRRKNKCCDITPHCFPYNRT